MWLGDKSKSLAYKPKSNELLMTVHRWFAIKSCPGDYLYNLHGKIAEEVNKQLAGSSSSSSSSSASGSSASKPSTTGTFKPYVVRVTVDALNIRKGPGTDYGLAGCITNRGAYTITAESSGKGATKWGKLKSGAGWVALDYVKKV